VTTTANPTSPDAPGVFSEDEVAQVLEQKTDPTLDDLDAAEIETPDLETSFEKIAAKAKRLSAKQVKNVLESILFVAPAPLSVDQLFEASGIDREKIEKALSSLQGERREGHAGLVLHEVASGWQFRTAPESSEFVRRFLKVKPQRLTRAALETLAIIAYRQPVTRPEMEDIRGVDTGAVLKALLDRRLIKIVGKKEEVGRPMLYGTTKEFLEFFALRDLNALPTLREFHELTEEHQEIVEKEQPPTALGTVEQLSDPQFLAKVAADEAKSEAALAELEQAMVAADSTSKTVSEVLDPKPPASSPEQT
jgi:segregation and condensation protein B